jgi:5-deoxy-glucuronate isomerase
LKKGEVFNYSLSGYETCIVPATGTISIDIEGKSFDQLGNRGVDVWDGEPEGAYVPVGAKVRIVCQSDKTETFIAGAKYDKVLEPFDVRKTEIDLVQYGSDETKTHRKIKHILGATQHDETYNFRFRPNYGSGLQMLQREDNEPGDAYHIMDGSTMLIDKGYHPCAVLPGYEMYYFTILGGLSQRSLKQYFQPTHEEQLHTIPGIMDMVAKFK